ncbi:MAG: serine/threonine-protein kinase [Planctomycetota bacterium]|nr:serine/threonine-protein kinase [Planctomycetota bacterium]
MPVAFLRPFGQGGFAPIARPRFILGSDLDCDLVDRSPGVAEHHATIRLQRGEYMLVAEDGCSLWVEGERVPLISLRDRDTVALAQGAAPWRFRSRVEGSFWPPEYTVGEAWLSHPAYEKAGTGPRRFGEGKPIAGRDPDRSRMVLGPHGPLIVKYVASIEASKLANHFLRFVAAVGGAVHPALAPVVDGGITPREGVPWGWMATRYVDGIRARDLIAPGPLSAERALRIVRSVAEGLAQLHHRGVVHGNLSLGNIVVPPTELAVLIDYGRAHALESPTFMSSDMRSEVDFPAPELLAGGEEGLALSNDVYGLSCVGAALLRGAVEAQELEPAAVLDEAIESSGPPHAAWLAALRAGLATDPSGRPSALDLAAALGAAELELGAAGRT